MLGCMTRTVILAGRCGARPLSHESGARAATPLQVVVKHSALCGIDPGWVQSHIDSARRNTTGTEKAEPLAGELVAKLVVHNLSKTEQGEEALSCTRDPDHLCPSSGGFSSCPKIDQFTKAIQDTLELLDSASPDRMEKIHWTFVSNEP
jgi:hypothetical protein